MGENSRVAKKRMYNKKNIATEEERLPKLVGQRSKRGETFFIGREKGLSAETREKERGKNY